MDRDGYVRLALGALLVIGGVGIVVAAVTGRDSYVSAGSAVICLTSAAAMVYTNRANDAAD